MSAYFNESNKLPRNFSTLKLRKNVSDKIKFNKYYLYAVVRLFISNAKSAIKEEKAYGVFFSFLTLYTMIGVVLYFSLTFTLSFADIFASLAIALVCLIYLYRYFVIRLILWPIIFINVGCLAAHIEDWRYSTKMLGGTIGANFTVQLMAPPEFKHSRYKLLVAIKKPVLNFLPKLVTLSVRKLPRILVTGDIIRGYAKLYSISGPIRPDSYDFAFYNYFKSIGATGYFLSKISYVGHNENVAWLDKIRVKLQNIRNVINDNIKAEQDNEEGAIASALITGERSGISEETNANLRKAGLAHILAISGLHMSIVTGLVFVAIRYFFSCFMLICCYFPIKKWAAFCSIITAAFYFAISGGSPSAQRSFVMVEIIFLAILFDKKAITLRNLLLAIWVTIIIYPHQILDPSFQMSFAAAAALISLYKTVQYDFIANLKTNKIRYFIAGSLQKIFTALTNTAMASFIAGTASGIFAIYHFGNFAPYAMFSNVMAGCVITILVMPFALISVLAMPFHWQAKPLFILIKTIIIVKKIAFFVAHLTPDFSIKFMDSVSFAILSLGFCLLIILRSKLRVLGIITISIGALHYYSNKLPIAVISENGKMALLGNALYTKHASKFILNDWQKAYLLKRKNFINLSSYKFYIVNSSLELKQALSDSAKHKIIYLTYYNPNQNSCRSDNNVIFITKQQSQLHGMVEIYDNLKMRWGVPSAERAWTEYRKYNNEGE